MGLLFSRSSASALELPRELRDASVSETEARSSDALRVLSCPSCQRRLCFLDREGAGSAAVWKASSSSVDKSLFGGSASLKCRACGQGRITVEPLGEMPTNETEGGSTSSPLRLALTSTGRNSFRPYCACVCGMYESVVARAASLLQADSISKTRHVNITQRTYKRSELAKLTEDGLPKPPMELLVIAHKISGQRNPITDQHGLYNNPLKHAWNRADVVLLCLFDVPPNYLSQLLDEQPTLRGLLCAGRFIPFFSSEDSTTEDVNGEATEAVAATARPQEQLEASWWLARCLDGRVPRYDGLPPDNGKSNEVVATLAAAAKGESIKKQPPEDAPDTVSSSCTVAVLGHVAESFENLALVRD